MAGNQNYQTPDDFFNALERKFGTFHLDAAATQDNARAAHWIDKEINGLNLPWGQHTRSLLTTATPKFKNVFCNPPWKRPGPWIVQAIDFVNSGGHNKRQAVMLFHSAFNSMWWDGVHKWAERVVIPVRERIEFLDPTIPEDKRNTNPRDSMLLVFRHRYEAREHNEQLPVEFWDWNNNGA